MFDKYKDYSGKSPHPGTKKQNLPIQGRHRIPAEIGRNLFSSLGRRPSRPTGSRSRLRPSVPFRSGVPSRLSSARLGSEYAAKFAKRLAFAAGLHYLCTEATCAYDQKRILHRTVEPLRRVVALQCGAHVRLFRQRGRADRLRFGRIDRRGGRCGSRKVSRRPRPGPEPHARHAPLRSSAAVRLHHPPSASPGQ